MIIQLPSHNTFYHWFMDLNRTMPGVVIPTPMPGDKDWRKSAMLFISINRSKLPLITLPTKLNFPNHEDWRKWAYSFIESVSN